MTTDKTRGFLTADDRLYLEGSKQYESEGTEYNTKRRIRERAEQGFKDFKLLFDKLDQKERKKLFQGDETRGVRSDPEFEEATRDTLAFLFQGGNGIHYLMGAGIRSGHGWTTLLTDAVQRVGEKEGFHVTNVEFDVDAEHVNVDRARQKAKKGEQLNASEMKVLVDEGDAEINLTDD